MERYSKKYKTLIQDSFQPLPIYEAPMFEQEVVGLPMLERVGDALFKTDRCPTEVKFNGRTQYVKKMAMIIFSFFLFPSQIKVNFH